MRKNKFNIWWLIICLLLVGLGFIMEVVDDYATNSLQIPFSNKQTDTTIWKSPSSNMQTFILGINKEGGWFNLSYLTPLDRLVIVFVLILFVFFLYKSIRSNYFTKTASVLINYISEIIFVYWIIRRGIVFIYTIRNDNIDFKIDNGFYFSIIFIIAAIFFKVFYTIIETGNELKKENDLTI